MLLKHPQYKPRGVVVGKVHWNCPGCGQYNRTTLSWRSFSGRCSWPKCRQRYVFGLSLRPVIKGARTDRIPPDCRVIDDSPRDPFPQALFDPVPWRAGQPVHRLEEPVEDPYPEHRKPH